LKELKDGNVVGSQRPMSTQLSFSAGRRTWVGQNENNLVKNANWKVLNLRYVTSRWHSCCNTLEVHWQT